MTGIDAGRSLLNLAAERDHCPIPAVVVISGRLNLANLPELQDQLRQCFCHGVLVSKGVDEEEAIQNAIKVVEQYCDIGIHLRDPRRLCPAISPREEYLLRRCVLSRPNSLGLDLQWWGEYQQASLSASGGNVTKVLAGHFLLDQAMGPSHPSFLKFANADGAAHTLRDAEVMVQKLSHIKIMGTEISRRRSLLVTQKVGGSVEPPVSLAQYLRQDPGQVQPQVGAIIDGIGGQLQRLGEADIQQWPVKRLLWKCHDRDKLSQVWAELGVGLTESLTGACDPVAVFDEICTSETMVYVGVRSCTHGDLNATNIALDVDKAKVEAYIFDAEGVHADAGIRDLATLEITSLLHHALDDGGSLVAPCFDFYGGFVLPPADLDCATGPALVRNTRKLVAEIRRHALQSADELVYAIVVFDAALLQLGGLAWQRSGNKIVIHNDAAALAALAAGWCSRLLSMPSQTKEGSLGAAS